MTHVRVWKFRPPHDRVDEFAAAYSGDGAWSALFRKAAGYRGMDLLRPLEKGGWWMTIDRWESRAHFEAFQQDFGSDYRTLDGQLEGIAGDEVFVGEFEED